jgi:uncharacterized damage-inducible protein DinB
MDADLGRLFLNSSASRLEQLSGRIAACLAKLEAEQVWARGSENENAIGNLVLHLCGNMRQWILSAVGGAPDARQRDAEFSARGSVPAIELASRLKLTVEEALTILRTFPSARLAERVVIQGYSVTLLEAIYHVVEHFAQHAGQIVFATKQLTGEDLGFYKHLSGPGPHTESTP